MKNHKQITDTILMIRPVRFRMNEETAVNNYFQQKTEELDKEITKKAQKEFDIFVEKLQNIGVTTLVVDDIVEQDTPDSVFPNNWVTFHSSGDIALYPMFAENRRRERREDILEFIEDKGFLIENVYDYTSAEEENIFLEGTGSMILDRVNEIAYCALSPRANEELFIEFCEDFEFTPVIFKAYQNVADKRALIYHTNVMMALAETFAIICLDCIDDKKERKNVIEHLKNTGKEIISITEEQMCHFAGNMLQVQGKNRACLIMSETAYNSLTSSQVANIERHCPILYTDLHTIETCGGGSARCMMAEIFLPKQ